MDKNTKHKESRCIGRNSEIDQLKFLLRKERLVVLTAPNQSGKSTLIHEGLIPLLQSDGFPAQAGTQWKCISIIPAFDIMKQIAKELANPGILRASDERTRHDYEEQIAHTLDNSPKGLIEVYRESAYVQEYNLLLMVDSLGASLAGGLSEDELRQFIDLANNTIQATEYGIYILLVINTQYLDKCRSFPLLNTWIEDKGMTLYPLNQFEFAKAIYQILQQQLGLREEEISEEQCETVVEQLGDTPDQFIRLTELLNYYDRTYWIQKIQSPYRKFVYDEPEDDDTPPQNRIKRINILKPKEEEDEQPPIEKVDQTPPPPDPEPIEETPIQEIPDPEPPEEPEPIIEEQQPPIEESPPQDKDEPERKPIRRIRIKRKK